MLLSKQVKNLLMTIDSKKVITKANISILQACESVNILIPRFCYYERLSIAGNCRMCLVEIEKSPKLIAACAMPVQPNMVVYTKSLAVKKAREGVLEFLLINHPLDCPICDQGGECDLQEQVISFGSDKSRFKEYKRAALDKQIGPLIKTIMTRCIHCTRCVRFANEVIGINSLGTSGRGSILEIGFYIKKLLKSEFSGNIIDLCPVGALTSKPYSFLTRSWEIKSTESIDIFDGLGSNIRIDTYGYELLRILPRLNENINESWISDKTRFAFDGIKMQRLYDPLIYIKNGTFEPISWVTAFDILINFFSRICKKDLSFGANIGGQTDLESIAFLHYLVSITNGFFVGFENSPKNYCDFQTDYRFTSTIKNIEFADSCLLLGLNPRLEGAIINLRLRKRYVTGNLKIISFGTSLNLTFPSYHLGSTTKNLIQFIEGKHAFCSFFSKSKKPLIIIGQALFSLFCVIKLKSLINILIQNTLITNNNNWAGLSYLHANAASVGLLELGIQNQNKLHVNFDLLYCIGDSKFKRSSGKTFIIYQGFQGCSSLVNADLILPTINFLEKQAFYVNTEGRLQETSQAIYPPLNIGFDSFIFQSVITAFSDLSKQSFFLFSTFKTFHFKNQIAILPIFNIKKFSLLIRFFSKHSFLPSSKLENFYLSDNISMISPIMNQCSKTLLNKAPFLNYDQKRAIF